MNSFAKVVTRNDVLHLYRNIIKQARSFDNYNFRFHAIRRIKWEFKKNINIDSSDVENKYEHGLRQLQIVKRQAIISKLYPEEGSVMENLP